MEEKTKKGLFHTFKPNAKSAWLKKIQTELKGKDIKNLHVKIADDLNISPFVHSEDLDLLLPPITKNSDLNHWAIGSTLLVQESKLTNKLLIGLLESGVNAAELIFTKPITSQSLKSLFQNVEHQFIETHVTLRKKACDPVSISELIHYINKADHRSATFLLDLSDELEYAKEYQEISKNILTENFPIRFLKISPPATKDSKWTHVDTLTAIIKKTIQLIKGPGDDKTIRHKLPLLCYFEIPLGPHFLTEIATLRSFKILWANILSYYNIPWTSPYIKIRIENEVGNTDENQQLFRSASSAVAAVISDVNSIFIGDAQDSQQQKQLKIKIQHILQLESHLDQVIDPVAGSYYIEKLTQGLTEHVWSKCIQ